MAVANLALASEGDNNYQFSAWEGPDLRVFLTVPPSLKEDSPVVIVMHGMQRNADDYRDQWHDLAITNNFLLVVPEFSSKDFPKSRGYNLGNIKNADGGAIDQSLWAFTAIDRIFASELVLNQTSGTR